MYQEAILTAVKERTKGKKAGQIPEFHYHIAGRQVRAATPMRKQRPRKSLQDSKFKRGCHNECFCHSSVGISKLVSDEEFPPWETELGIDNMIHAKRCHSRLNHRRQFSGVYKRRLDPKIPRIQDPKVALLRHQITASLRNQASNMRTVQAWTEKLRSDDTVDNSAARARSAAFPSRRPPQLGHSASEGYFNKVGAWSQLPTIGATAAKDLERGHVASQHMSFEATT